MTTPTARVRVTTSVLALALLTPLAVALGFVTAGPAGAGPASAEDPPAVAASGPSTALPWELAPSTQRSYGFHIDGTGTPSTTELSVSGEGVGAQLPASSFDTTDDVSFEVRFTAAPGVHRVTLSFSREGATTRELTYTVWVRGTGGPHLSGSDSLARVRWVFDASSYEADRVNHEQTPVWFTDDRWAYVGYPPKGLHTCDAQHSGCHRYWFDAATGLVEIDQVAIGKVLPADGTIEQIATGDPHTWGLYLDGITLRSDYWEEGSGGEATADHQLAFYGAGHRFDGTWQWLDRDDMPGDISVVRLRLDPDGRYVFKQDFFDGGWHTRRGHYGLGKGGLLRLHQGSKVRKLTLATCRDAAGAKSPQTCLVLGLKDMDWPTNGGILLPFH